MLDQATVQRFVEDGFIRLDAVFSAEVAERCRAALWERMGLDPDDPATWTEPVIRLDRDDAEPFWRAITMPDLHEAFDQLVGKGRWQPPDGIDQFVIRFPSDIDPGDDDWHVVPASDAPDRRIDVRSTDRALLLLILFSDVGPDDAPTRLRIGSHLEVARLLAAAGAGGLTAAALADRVDETVDGPEATATGKAGTIYLCHPFLVHAAQGHHGYTPRFMALPSLLSTEPLGLERPDGAYSPVETAIRQALSSGG